MSEIKTATNRLDQLIKVYSSYNGEVHDLLTELQQRRESALRPATKFLSNTKLIQIRHVLSEFNEVVGAYINHEFYLSNEVTPGKIDKEMCNESFNNLTEELVDLQMSCETMLAILGLDEQQRNEARRKVVDKNEARNYYTQQSTPD